MFWRRQVGATIRYSEFCEVIDDEGHWLFALISDTGKRLSGAAGLHKGDIILDVPVPSIKLRPHAWRRFKVKFRDWCLE